ncbi:MAG: rubrerythrin [Thermoleophilia bacterium]|nr:rubrerythrin [Thermoleophilia bacterium]
MATTSKLQATRGVLSEGSRSDRDEIVEMLKQAYWMEMETVMSYVSCSINPDGLRAQEVIEALEKDVLEELGHARQFGQRIKELYGVVPGSMEFTAEQTYLQPPANQSDILPVIRGVIEAETGAIDHYNKIIEMCDGGVDPVTADMVTTILADEEGHRRLFEGFIKEFEAPSALPN